jgi:Nif-specific regulatory protein
MSDERRKFEEISLLYEVSSEISRSTEIDDVIKPVLHIMSEHLGILRGMLTILNRKTGEIFIETAYGLSSAEQARGIYKPGEGVIGKVVDTGEPVYIEDIANHPEFLNKTKARKDIETNEKTLSFACVPIKIGEEVLGALCGDHYSIEGYNFNRELQILSIIATMIAQSVKLHQASHEENDQLKEENIRLHAALKERFASPNIIGSSRKMQVLFTMIEKIAGMNTTVLILGESGVGKELIANAIHYSSDRTDAPFIKFNCAALPESIIESELFGHEKGAFTNADSMRKGRFELADGGTLFIDEIGEMTPAVQTKFLRILQEREFERIGGSKTINVDVRVLAATNRDLEAMVEEGTFRQDLYYRLNVFPILVPSLRDRKTDIPLLADHFVEKYNKLHGKNIRRISTPAIDMLMSYHWPGNVRELENCIERALILSDDMVIHGYHLPPSLQTAQASGTVSMGTLSEKLEAIELEIIVEALKNTNGNMAEAARILGITERIMGLRIKKHNINFRQFRTSS